MCELCDVRKKLYEQEILLAMVYARVKELHHDIVQYELGLGLVTDASIRYDLYSVLGLLRDYEKEDDHHLLNVLGSGPPSSM